MSPPSGANTRSRRQGAHPKLTRIELPGFGLPLDYAYQVPNLFRNALNCITGGDNNLDSLPLTTLREFTMMQLMNQLTDKPSWHTKVFDEEITSKWKAEALATEGRDITPKMVDWCIAELQYKAKIFLETGAVSVYNGDVVKSDTAVSSSLKDELKAAVAPLENVRASLRDWHPGSGEKVLDLVHPSLFPLVYGRSRILLDSLTSLEDCVERCGEGKVVPVPSDEEINPEGYSTKFQWLPCEINITDGDCTKITSYINNLHPQKHKNLYTIIEQIISCTIPLWNQTLTPLKAVSYGFNRIHYAGCEYDPDPDNFPEDQGPQQGEDEDEDTFYERRQSWAEGIRQVVQPEPGEFQPPTVPDYLRDQYFEEGTTTLTAERSVDLRRDYHKRGLQVIVKLANIHLTPEKPEYEGGTWHVEGQLNEYICATAIYYYDSVNITTSRLAFRQMSETDVDVDYEQDKHDWLPAVFGCEQYGSSVQYVGAVDTKEGRLITFPNILQHQVQPFKLVDPTKPGHRKVLALFLIDPNMRILSTAEVPCQQREWWSEAVRLPHNLPAELRDEICRQVEEFPISLEEAKELRLELMEERKVFVGRHGEAFEANQFSLCEH